jgi:flagellar biogenesis protein FliO
MPCRTYGIEPNSSLFDTSSSPAATNGSKGVPLDLPTDTPSASPSLIDTLGRVLAALTLVIVLIVATIWGLKLIWEKKGITSQGEDGKSLRVLSSIFIGPRKTIHLVEVGKRILVVGVGNEEIHPLDIINDPAEVEALKKTSPQGFPVLLEKILHRTDSVTSVEETEKIIAESKKTLGGYIERLKGASKKNKKALDESDEIK